MAAYLIAEHKISNPEAFKGYLTGVLPILERHGAKFLTKPGAHRRIAGEWRPDRVVIIEFPDLASLDAFFASPEYQPLVAFRQSAGPEVMFSVDGASS